MLAYTAGIHIELSCYIGLAERPLIWGVVVRPIGRVQLRRVELGRVRVVRRCYVRLDAIQALHPLPT